MDKALVTVVLPIYNVERYLDRCMESIAGQTYTNLEILMIDDGSPDRCPEMCDEWARKDSRVRVIHKKNAGLGEARNTGIEHATGDYICFFDSDDYVHPETVEKCMTRLIKHNADVVVFGVNFVDSLGRVTASYPPAGGERVFKNQEVREEFLPELIAPSVRKDGGKSFYMTAWSMLYSMDAINKAGWRYVSERKIVAEDVYSLLTFFAHVITVAVVPEALYYYCENDTSLSRKYMEDRYQRVRHFYIETQKLCEEIGYDEIIRHRAIRPFLAFTIAALKQELVSSRKFIQRYRQMKNMIGDAVLQDALYRIRKDNVGRNRSILFFCMRNKLYALCYILLRYKAG